MGRTIVIVGTLDTKGEEIGYLKQTVDMRGHDSLVIDCGVVGEPTFVPEITRQEVARAAGTSLDELVMLEDERKAMDVMALGAAKLVGKLYSNERLDGILAIGGSMGTKLGLSVMDILPIGVPKLMVSTIAFAPFFMRYAGSELIKKDLTMMQSAVDFWGMNSVVKGILDSAVGAITGMVEMKEEKPAKPLIGITTLGGVACNYVPLIKPLVEARGYELVVFHTVGIGGRYFEEFVEQGALAGVLDLSTHEVMEELYGGANLGAGRDRMEAAARKGIPQVVSPGCLDFFAWRGPVETFPPHLKRRIENRKIHIHSGFTIPIRASKEEMAQAGKTMAEKLNKAIGPAVVLIPTKGFEERDKPTGVFYDPEANRGFTKALKKHIRPGIKVTELDLHINDKAFAEAAVGTLFNMMEKTTD
ncbi:MAG: Tm-1-like ATP-binding domain-containing protein [Chloroflexi bacterium]|nr:Tm-1-like ATP-binding domain-containing protein [Chloroflexota bacterium]